jgi:hypothetical protein
MTETPNDTKEFKIGLAMSGAISAGAYTAGVFDFLIDALEAWAKKLKDSPEDTTVPRHKVILATMAGASAGAITCSVGALAAGRGPKPTPDESHRNKLCKKGEPAFRVLPELYTAWVERPDFTISVPKNPEMPGRLGCDGSLLSTEDLDPYLKGEDPTIVSLLNSGPLHYIGHEALSQIGRRTGQPAPYIPKNLHVYFTLTNMRGIPYEIKFTSGDASGTSSHSMLYHGDWAHYCLENLGTSTFEVSEWAKNDNAQKRLDIVSLSKEFPIKGEWSDYIENTLASGAFPGGLSARKLKNELKNYEGRHWPLPFKLSAMQNIKPTWPQTIENGFAAVDGGAIDNDPFEFVRYALTSYAGENSLPDEINSDPKQADRAIIMISPFPATPNFQAKYVDESTGLLAVIQRFIPMFIQHSRFKPGEIFNALNPEDASRWIISPKRYNKDKLEEFGIACGLLDGFGGFLEREFRDHDYELGRKNCQDFLANWFGLPSNNPSIDPIVSLPQKLVGVDNKHLPTGLKAIIPLYGDAAIPVQVRDWPQVNKDKLTNLEWKLGMRLDRLYELLSKKYLPDEDWRRGLGVFWDGWNLGVTIPSLRKYLLEKMLTSLKADLIKRNQYLG